MKSYKILLIAMVTFFAASLFAHPAADIMVSYDKETMILTVEYKHSVSDPEKHYIDDVEVIFDDEELVVQKLMSQDTKDGGKVLYKVRDLKSGDEIKVKIDCNRFGGKSVKYTIE